MISKNELGDIKGKPSSDERPTSGFAMIFAMIIVIAQRNKSGRGQIRIEIISKIAKEIVRATNGRPLSRFEEMELEAFIDEAIFGCEEIIADTGICGSADIIARIHGIDRIIHIKKKAMIDARANITIEANGIQHIDSNITDVADENGELIGANGIGIKGINESIE